MPIEALAPTYPVSDLESSPALYLAVMAGEQLGYLSGYHYSPTRHRVVIPVTNDDI